MLNCVVVITRKPCCPQPSLEKGKRSQKAKGSALTQEMQIILDGEHHLVAGSLARPASCVSQRHVPELLSRVTAGHDVFTMHAAVAFRKDEAIYSISVAMGSRRRRMHGHVPPPEKLLGHLAPGTLESSCPGDRPHARPCPARIPCPA